MTKEELQNELIQEKKEHLETLDKYKRLMSEHIYLQKKNDLISRKRTGYK